MLFPWGGHEPVPRQGQNELSHGRRMKTNPSARSGRWPQPTKDRRVDPLVSLAALLDVPNFYRAVVGRGRDLSAVRRDGQRGDLTGVLFQDLQGPTRIRVPDHDPISRIDRNHQPTAR